MKFKIHSCCIVKNIVLLFIEFAVAFFVAVAFSGAREFTASHFAMIFIPVWIIAGAYFYAFISTAVLTMSSTGVSLDMKFGRTRHSEINFSDISAYEKKDFFAGLFGAKRIIFSTNDHLLYDTVSSFNRYLYLSADDCFALLKAIGH